jgi:flagellar motor switch protein FliN/FliY
MSDQTLLAFARKIDSGLLQLGRIPLHGQVPQIDFDRLFSLIATKLNAPQLVIRLMEASWRSSSELYEGFPHDAFRFPVGVSPLKGEALWMSSHRDAAQLVSWFLKKKRNEVHSELLQEGFTLYLMLHILDILQEEKPFNEFTLQLKEESTNQTSAYCLDIKLSLENHSCYGRLLVSEKLVSSWQNHFASLREIFSLSSLAKNIEVPVGILVGSVLLSQEEWQELREDDVLLLDRGSYNPRQREGVASLSLGATPLFHVSIRENRLKLLEPALFYEEDMDKREPTSETSPPSEAQTMAIKELPLFITVELSRLRMTVGRLTELAPGNILELPLDPTQSVLLTVNGQKIGRGELVHLGEALGVRILETS